MCRSASKSAAAHADARPIARQSKRRRPILEPAVSLVEQERVAHALRADHGRRQIEIELAVAVGVKRRNRRPKPARARPTSAALPVKSARLHPPLAFRQASHPAAGRLELRCRRLARCGRRQHGERIHNVSIPAHVPILFVERVARPGAATDPSWSGLIRLNRSNQAFRSCSLFTNREAIA